MTPAPIAATPAPPAATPSGAVEHRAAPDGTSGGDFSDSLRAAKAAVTPPQRRSGPVATRPGRTGEPSVRGPVADPRDHPGPAAATAAALLAGATPPVVGSATPAPATAAATTTDPAVETTPRAATDMVTGPALIWAVDGNLGRVDRGSHQKPETAPVGRTAPVSGPASTARPASAAGTPSAAETPSPAGTASSGDPILSAATTAPTTTRATGTPTAADPTTAKAAQTGGAAPLPHAAGPAPAGAAVAGSAAQTPAPAAGEARTPPVPNIAAPGGLVVNLPAAGVRTAAAPANASSSGAATPTPATQLVSVIAPLQSSEGSHQVTLELQPDGLGTVKATVIVDPQQVTIQLTTDSSSARAALEQALPLLRHQFSANGSSATVLLSTGAGSGDAGSRDGRPLDDRRPSRGTAAKVALELDRAAQPLVPTAHRLIDIQL